MSNTRHRKIINSIKKQFAENIESASAQYKRAIVRQIDYEFRVYASTSSATDTAIDIEKFADNMLKRFRIPVNIRNQFIDEITDSQRNINKVWDDYFSEVGSGKAGISGTTYEQLTAFYQVDFKELETTVVDTVKKETAKAVRAGYGYNTLRSQLVKRDLGESQSRTLANTALAQYDNAYMVENAKQAGINSFIYDGTLSKNSRPFCVLHFKRKYTIKQLQKLDNGMGLPVETSLGGYNCTHYLTPFFNDKKTD